MVSSIMVPPKRLDIIPCYTVGICLFLNYNTVFIIFISAFTLCETVHV